MAERKQRKNMPDLLDLDEPERFVITNPEPVELGSGYSISIDYDKDGRPLIYVKKYGEIDTKGLRREIERSYPGASIQGLEKPELIKIEETQKRKHRSPRPKPPSKNRKAI